MLLPLFVFATPIFLALGEDEAIAASAGYISMWFIPFVYSTVFALTMQMYLQAQQKNTVVAWLSAAQLAVHVPLSWLLVTVMDLGVAGAMCALCVSSWLVIVGEFVYIFGGWCHHPWTGFTMVAFHDIIPAVKLSVSSSVMLCLELWYYAILVLLAGYMKNAQVSISAFSICLNVSGLEFMISMGMMGAAIKLGYLFTGDEDVVVAVADLSLLLSFSLLLNAIYPVLSGVAVGAGLQSKVAIISSFVFMPLDSCWSCAWICGSTPSKGDMDWDDGVVTQTLALSYMTWKTEWDEQVNSINNYKIILNFIISQYYCCAGFDSFRWHLKSGEGNQHLNACI
ncbi:hypothetical protein SASPL_117816 [Salvia splendens]|uniref:Multidrug resistance protein, MATE family n=1 Tax=Salvia splendens TaxID=180675 RepID=A0A8X8XVN3_SALSN|nr:hypothetical protein SASPL_117816 [Salvia splendens]